MERLSCLWAQDKLEENKSNVLDISVKTMIDSFVSETLMFLPVNFSKTKMNKFWKYLLMPQPHYVPKSEEHTYF